MIYTCILLNLRVVWECHLLVDPSMQKLYHHDFYQDLPLDESLTCETLICPFSEACHKPKITINNKLITLANH